MVFTSFYSLQDDSSDSLYPLEVATHPGEARCYPGLTRYQGAKTRDSNLLVHSYMYKRSFKRKKNFPL